MRIIAGRWRGRALVAPAGHATRPTAQRLRQAIFDMLWHAPWGGQPLFDGAAVLDLFAGTGALGLEALSRGAAAAEFVERDPAALAALARNVAACGAADLSRIVAGDVTRLPPGPATRLVFADPPYGQGLVEASLAALTRSGRIGAGCLLVAELARDDPTPPLPDVLVQRAHGTGRVVVARLG